MNLKQGVLIMSSRVLLTFLILLVMVTSLSAMQKTKPAKQTASVRIGQNISEAIKVMSQAGIKEGLGLALATDSKSEELTGWPVNNGYLIAAYSTVNGRIVSLAIYLPDKDPRIRSKTKWKNHTFVVKSYVPSTGEMLVIIPAREKA